jgi:glycine/D-amino acid oxidase-like deaminating enzyme
VDARARVVIIGGGIGGCSLAYHLARLGETDVVLLEKGELTSGSTWHAAGLCTQFNASRNLTKLLMDSIELYEGLEAATGRPVDFRRVGSVRLATTEDRMEEFLHSEGKARVLGLEFEVIGLDRIRELCPLLNLDDVLGAAWIASDGYIDPSSAANALAQGARDLGIRIERRTLVPGEAGMSTRTGAGSRRASW